LSSTFPWCIHAGFSAEKRKEFVSLENSGAICEAVTRPVDGVYLLSDDGYWQGNVKFKYSQALVAVELHNYYATHEAYRIHTKQLNALTNSFNELSRHQNLAWNLLLIMELMVNYRAGDFVENVYTIAIPSIIYDTEFKFAAISSRKQKCPVYSFPLFDTSAGLLTATFDASMMQLACNATVDTLTTRNQLGDIAFEFDMNSFSVAAAVNMGLLNISQLEDMPFPPELVPFTAFTVDSVPFRLKQLINVRHPGMNPVYCVVYADSSALLACFLRQTFSFYLPVLNHAGGSLATLFNVPHFCDW
jgi:hypothetical protein